MPTHNCNQSWDSSQAGRTSRRIKRRSCALRFWQIRAFTKLNQAAASGHLKGFEPGVGGSEPLTGSYDKASGIVTLPAFEPGSAPTTNLRGSLRLQEMSIRFANSSYVDANQQRQHVTQDMVTNLQSTINSSPTLAKEINRAVTTAIDSRDPKARCCLKFCTSERHCGGRDFQPGYQDHEHSARHGRANPEPI